MYYRMQCIGPVMPTGIILLKLVSHLYCRNTLPNLYQGRIMIIDMIRGLLVLAIHQAVGRERIARRIRGIERDLDHDHRTEIDHRAEIDHEVGIGRIIEEEITVETIPRILLVLVFHQGRYQEAVRQKDLGLESLLSPGTWRVEEEAVEGLNGM